LSQEIKNCLSSGNFSEAERLCGQILSQQPGNADALHLMGVTKFQMGRSLEGADYVRRAIEREPGRAEFQNNLGLILADSSATKSIAAFRSATRLEPNLPEAWLNLARMLREGDEAIAAFAEVLRINPNCFEAHYALAHRLKETGRIEDAVDHYRRAVDLNPQSSTAHDDLLYAMYFDPGCGKEQILAEHLAWARRHADPLKPGNPHFENDRNPDRRLRIGYVSPDFRAHPIGRFMWPLLAEHDRKGFEVFCYDTSFGADVFTPRLREGTDVWREATRLTDAALAEMIRADRIDILVDLTMHMAFNRLLVFARKPAPVQVTYLAYPGTTGVSTIDYRITDANLETEEMARGSYVEKSVWVSSYWCYQGWEQSPETQEPPLSRNGFVTFGCLNNFCKVNDRTLDAWGRILAGTGESRLILLAPEGDTRGRARDQMARHGVSADRIEFVDRTGLTEYLNLYQRIDIALDPFPYVGGTTTCDALWMGAPVVTLAGQTAIGRGGVSILNNLELTEFVAENIAKYVDISTRLAKDLAKLDALRKSLRGKMRASRLMNGKQFAADFERVYREMWKNWCAGK
jgi:protein O-GlcNAc transferase